MDWQCSANDPRCGRRRAFTAVPSPDAFVANPFSSTAAFQVGGRAAHHRAAAPDRATPVVSFFPTSCVFSGVTAVLAKLEAV